MEHWLGKLDIQKARGRGFKPRPGLIISEELCNGLIVKVFILFKEFNARWRRRSILVRSVGRSLEVIMGLRLI